MPLRYTDTFFSTRLPLAWLTELTSKYVDPLIFKLIHQYHFLLMFLTGVSMLRAKRDLMALKIFNNPYFNWSASKSEVPNFNQFYLILGTFVFCQKFLADWTRMDCSKWLGLMHFPSFDPFNNTIGT